MRVNHDTICLLIYDVIIIMRYSLNRKFKTTKMRFLFEYEISENSVS